MLENQKVVLITGAARRIGAKTARILHQAGMNVVVHYRSSHAEAIALCADLNKERKNSAIAVQAELTDMKSLARLIESGVKAWGQLDVLVNNASRFYKTPLGSITEQTWSDLLDSNLKVPFFLSQMALPYLKQTQGCIVNIADIHGESPLRDYSVYSLSKAGLLMLTKAFAKECGPLVRVNAVSPAGGACWAEGENSLSDAAKVKIIEQTALKRQGSAMDIAQAVLFLVRDAGYITGQVLTVDGGRAL